MVTTKRKKTNSNINNAIIVICYVCYEEVNALNKTENEEIR